jgi:hypothetical protein
LFVPPTAVPTQEIGLEVGVIVPAVGLAAPMRKIGIAQTKLIAIKMEKNVQRLLFMIRPCLKCGKKAGKTAYLLVLIEGDGPGGSHSGAN